MTGIFCSGQPIPDTDLERLTKPLNVSPADEYAGKREECLMDIGTALIADA